MRLVWTSSESSGTRKDFGVEIASFFDRISVDCRRTGMDGCMREKAQMEQCLSSSAAAFVEGGGVQDASDDDACSICLEAFSDSNPSAVTKCKHEFHLQCVLEWCQRSSQCPMCWQAISMKDPLSQQLLEAIEQERNAREKESHTTTVFRHPLLGDFEISVGANDTEVEERILQHLASAAVIRRPHRHLRRREGRRSRSAAAHGHPQMMVVSATDEAASGDSISSNPWQEGHNEPSAAIISALPIAPVAATEETAANTSVMHFATTANVPAGPNNRNHSSPVNQDEAGPSDNQSFSESLKSRLQSVSTSCKDSITKNTRGWKERWFTNNSTTSNIGSEAQREVSAGIAAVSRMTMELLGTRDCTGPSSSTPPNNIQSASDINNQRDVPQ